MESITPNYLCGIFIDTTHTVFSCNVLRLTRLVFCYPADQMNAKDQELKGVIQHLWPVQSKKLLNLLVPSNEGLYRLSYW